MSLPPMPGDTIPFKQYKALYMSVGELVINWSVAESVIVKITAVIYQAAGGNHIEAEIPRAFGRHLKFLRLCFRRIAALASYRDEAIETLQTASSLVVIRNAIIHGALSGYNAKTEQFVFAKIDVDERERIHVLNTVTTTMLDLRGAVIDSQKMTRSLLDLLKRLHEEFLGKD